jgi:predicted negative regulator of RcsB-dependent stress response
MIFLSIVSILLVILLGTIIGFFYWYVRSTSGYFDQVSAAYRDVVETVAEFRSHLDLIAGMERFVEEPVIKNLQKHAAATAALLLEIERGITFQEIGKSNESTTKAE